MYLHTMRNTVRSIPSSYQFTAKCEQIEVGNFGTLTFRGKASSGYASVYGKDNKREPNLLAFDHSYNAG